MKTYESIAFLSLIVWLAVPLIHYKSKHFWFFLFLGLNDVASGILWFGFGLSSQTLWIPFYYLIVLSIDKEFLFNNWKIIVFGFILVLVLNYYSTTFIQNGFVLISHTIILTLFIKYLFWGFVENNVISLFYVVMTFYGMFSVYKFVLMLNSVHHELSIYFVTTIIQIIIGMYLIIQKRDIQFLFKRFEP